MPTTYLNPVFDDNFPDPTILRAPDGWYYAYGTQTKRAGRIINLQVARSRDLVRWDDLGEGLPEKPVGPVIPDRLGGVVCGLDFSQRPNVGGDGVLADRDDPANLDLGQFAGQLHLAVAHVEGICAGEVERQFGLVGAGRPQHFSATGRGGGLHAAAKTFERDLLGLLR